MTGAVSFTMQRAIRPSARKATDEQIIAAYAELQSVRKVAERFGMCGQSVHERLQKMGLSRPINTLSDEHRRRILEEYTAAVDTGKLEEFAASLGRSKQLICRYAGQMGLTDQGRKKPYIGEKVSRSMRRWHANNEHPRGMLGKTQTEKARQAVSDASTRRWAAMSTDERAATVLKSMKSRVAKYGSLAGKTSARSWKAAWREIGGKKCFYRSRWEANYARYLQWLKERGEILDWEHEPETFWFEEIKRGVRSYLPDFRVVDTDGAASYHEVKGWMDQRSRTTITRMRKYYPQHRLIVIDAAAYKSISSVASALIPGWEAKTDASHEVRGSVVSRGATRLFDELRTELPAWRSSASKRAEIGSRVGLTGPSVAQSLSELVRAGWIVRLGTARYAINLNMKSSGDGGDR